MRCVVCVSYKVNVVYHIYITVFNAREERPEAKGRFRIRRAQSETADASLWAWAPALCSLSRLPALSGSLWSLTD